MILLYADDPGGANYIAPLADALRAENITIQFLIAPALEKYADDRGMDYLVRMSGSTAESLLESVTLLIVGTSEDPDCFAHDLVAAARVANVDSLGVVDMKVNADSRFRGRSDDPLTYVPNWLAVTDEDSAASYVELGFPSARLLVYGHPHYDQIRARRRELQALDREEYRQAVFPVMPDNRPIWLFLSEGIDQLNPSVSFRNSEYTLSGRGGSDFRSVIVLEEVLDAAAQLDPCPWVVLRLHPKNRPEDFDALSPELGMISKDGDPLPLVWSADLVIGMTTMLLVETYLLGRPHLSVLPRELERNWLYTLENGLSKSVCTRDELLDVLLSDRKALEVEGDDLPAGAIAQLLEFIKHGK